MTEAVLYEVKTGVAHLPLHRPESLNALDTEMIDGLVASVTEAIYDDGVGALLLTGKGKAFCAGGNVRLLSQLLQSEQPAQEALKAVSHMHEALLALFRCPKPVVAAVGGPTAGAGLGVMMTADLIWSARSAHFTVAFTAIGASPDGGTTFLLPRLVGPKLAAELVLTNRRVSAEEALQAGLVSRVLDDDALHGEAAAAAQRLAAGPGNAFAGAKELLRKSQLHGYETQLEEERRGVAEAATGDEFREGVMAFLEKRPPRFRS